MMNFTCWDVFQEARRPYTPRMSRQLSNRPAITLLDGGMGQELIARTRAGATGLWSTKVMMDEPQLVADVHRDYFAAGAQIATTNTYAIHRDRLSPYDIEDQFEALHLRACELAIRARDAHGSGQVAGALGPTGWSYRPDLAPPAEQAATLYEEIARLQASMVDLFICETMSSVDQARGALMGAGVAGKPVWLAVSVQDDDGTRLRSGERLLDIAPLIAQFNPAAVLVNCSSPEALDNALPLLHGLGVRIGGYANGFRMISTAFEAKGSTVDQLEKRTDLNPIQYADFADGWITGGASIVGGCCEVGPAHIRELARRYATPANA